MYPESHFNHRVLAHVSKSPVAGDSVFFQIHEVYYSKGVPDGYTKDGVTVHSEEGIEGLKWTLDHMIKCLESPILWAGDRFPQEYVPGEFPAPTPPTKIEDDIREPSFEEKVIEKLDKLREAGLSEERILAGIDSVIEELNMVKRLDESEKKSQVE